MWKTRDTDLSQINSLQFDSFFPHYIDELHSAVCLVSAFLLALSSPLNYMVLHSPIHSE